MQSPLRDRPRFVHRVELVRESVLVERLAGHQLEDLRHLGEHDPVRPCIEVYRSPREVDCLLPVVG